MQRKYIWVLGFIDRNSEWIQIYVKILWNDINAKDCTMMMMMMIKQIYHTEHSNFISQKLYLRKVIMLYDRKKLI